MSTSVVARQGVGSLRQSSHHRDHLACRQKQGRYSAKLPGVDTCGPVCAIMQPRSDLQVWLLGRPAFRTDAHCARGVIFDGAHRRESRRDRLDGCVESTRFLVENWSRVDVEVADGRLSEVAVSGDFFLEPDSALDDINAALRGMPADSDAEQLAHAISTALDESVSMIGFTPQSVGIAIRRALGHATSWADHTFDLIPPVVLDPAMHVALDEVIAREVASG